MKTKDIKPGVVYAYRASKYDSVRPVVFVTEPSPEAVYRAVRRPRHGEPRYLPAPGAKPQTAKGFSGSAYGYLAVTISAVGDDPNELAAVTLDDVLALKFPDRLTDASVLLVTVPGHIIGPFAEVAAEDERQRQARDAQYKREEQDRKQRMARMASVLDRLTTLGIPSRSEGPPHLGVVINVGDAEKIIALLEAAE